MDPIAITRTRPDLEKYRAGGMVKIAFGCPADISNSGISRL